VIDKRLRILERKLQQAASDAGMALLFERRTTNEVCRFCEGNGKTKPRLERCVVIANVMPTMPVSFFHA